MDIHRVASKMNSRPMPHGENKHLNLKNKSNAGELIFVTANIITDKIALVHPLQQFCRAEATWRPMPGCMRLEPGLP
jgi:hypothetical protein